MSKKPKSPVSENPSKGIVVSDTVHAPIIYFELAPTFGNLNGVISITLASARHLSSGSAVTTDFIAVAHLRCTIAAAIDLRRALDQALLLGAPTPGGSN